MCVCPEKGGQKAGVLFIFDVFTHRKESSTPLESRMVETNKSLLLQNHLNNGSLMEEVEMDMKAVLSSHSVDDCACVEGGGTESGTASSKLKPSPSRSNNFPSTTTPTPPLIPSADTALAISRAAELSSALHASELQSGHLRLSCEALTNRLQEERKAAGLISRRAVRAEQRALLLEAELSDVVGTTSNSALPLSLPDLRGQALQSAERKLEEAEASAGALETSLMVLQEEFTREKRSVQCEILALKEQLRQATSNLAQRTLLFAAAKRDAVNSTWEESQTAKAGREALAVATAREGVLQDQLSRLTERLCEKESIIASLEKESESTKAQLVNTAEKLRETEVWLAGEQMRSATLDAEASSRPTDVLEAEGRFAQEIRQIEDRADQKARADAEERSRLLELLEKRTADAAEARAKSQLLTDDLFEKNAELVALKDSWEALAHRGGDSLTEYLLREVEYWKGEAEAANIAKGEDSDNRYPHNAKVSPLSGGLAAEYGNAAIIH